MPLACGFCHFVSSNGRGGLNSHYGEYFAPTIRNRAKPRTNPPHPLPIIREALCSNSNNKRALFPLPELIRLAVLKSFACHAVHHLETESEALLWVRRGPSPIHPTTWGDKVDEMTSRIRNNEITSDAELKHLVHEFAAKMLRLWEESDARATSAAAAERQNAPPADSELPNWILNRPEDTPGSIFTLTQTGGKESNISQVVGQSNRLQDDRKALKVNKQTSMKESNPQYSRHGNGNISPSVFNLESEDTPPHHRRRVTSFKNKASVAKEPTGTNVKLRQGKATLSRIRRRLPSADRSPSVPTTDAESENEEATLPRIRKTRRRLPPSDSSDAAPAADCNVKSENENSPRTQSPSRRARSCGSDNSILDPASLSPLLRVNVDLFRQVRVTLPVEWDTTLQQIMGAVLAHEDNPFVVATASVALRGAGQEAAWDQKMWETAIDEAWQRGVDVGYEFEAELFVVRRR